MLDIFAQFIRIIIIIIISSSSSYTVLAISQSTVKASWQ